MKTRTYLWLAWLVLAIIPVAALSEDENYEFSLEPVLNKSERINEEIVLGSEIQTDKIILLGEPPIVGSDSVSGDSGFAQIHSYNPDLSLYSILVKNISGSDDKFNVPFVNKLSYKINNGPNESDIMEVSKNLLCHWKENSELKVDKLIKGNLHYIGYFAPLDHNNNERYNHAVCDVDVYRATNLPAGGYCVEFRGNDCLKVTISYPKSKNNVDYKTVTNICCKLDGQEVPGLRRGYFEMKHDAPEVSVQIRFKDEEALQKNEGKSQEIKAYNYSLKLTHSRPVVFIHDLGDGPKMSANDQLKEPTFGKEKYKYHSKSIEPIRTKLPLIQDWHPLRLVEYPWDSSSECLEQYSSKSTGNDYLTLEDFVSKQFSDVKTLKPIYLCHGAGGMILINQMAASSEFAGNHGGIFFVGTPFFGFQAANFADGNSSFNKGFIKSWCSFCGIGELPFIDEVSDENIAYFRTGTAEIWERRETIKQLKPYLWKKGNYCIRGDYTDNVAYAKLADTLENYRKKGSILVPALGIGSGVSSALLAYAGCFPPTAVPVAIIGGSVVLFEISQAVNSAVEMKRNISCDLRYSRWHYPKYLSDIFYQSGDGLVSRGSSCLPDCMGWNKNVILMDEILLDGRSHGGAIKLPYPLTKSDMDIYESFLESLKDEVNKTEEKDKI